VLIIIIIIITHSLTVSLMFAFTTELEKLVSYQEIRYITLRLNCGKTDVKRAILAVAISLNPSTHTVGQLKTRSKPQ